MGYLPTVYPPSDPVEATWMNYASFDACPTDEATVPDGDDSLLAPSGGGFVEGPGPFAAVYRAEVAEALAAAAALQRKRIVILKRQIKPGEHGKDVVALKRALGKAGFFRPASRIVPVYGPVAVGAVKKFQRAHGLRADGVYGPLTHVKLAGFYDNYGVWLLGQAPKPAPPADKKRQAVVECALFLYHSRWLVHYTQSSLRMYGVKHHYFPPRVTPYEDCSSFATLCFDVAGLPDPNGLGYNGLGFTGTLAQHGTRVGAAKAASLCFWGPRPTFSHVAVAVDSHHVVSHGSEIGPLYLPINYRGNPTEIRDYVAG